MKQLYKITCVVLLMACGLSSPAQTVDSSLAAIFYHTLDSMKTVLNVKSLSVAVQLNDGAIWAGAKGFSSQAPQDTVTPGHAYAIGSVTKTFTAACVLQLADEGLLSLDDSLHNWLDTFANINPNITIRQLLRHQSGLFNYTNSPIFGPTLEANFDSIFSLTDILETFVGPPIFQPGAAWSYCNTNYTLLGMIIETVTGQPYYQEIRDRLITPLNLAPIASLPHEPLPPPVAQFWFDSNGDGITDAASPFLIDWTSSNSAAGPAGSYYTTATEMAKWMRAYMSGSLLSPGMMDQLKTTVTSPGGKYGLGIMERNFIGYKGYGHGGDIGYAASVFYFPEKDLSIAVQINDGKYNSSALPPVIIAYLKAWLDWTPPVSSSVTVQQQNEALLAFPNPFQSSLTVRTSDGQAPQDLRLTLTDAHGRPIAESSSNGFGQLDALPAGTYFIRAEKQGRPAGNVTVQKIE